MDIVQEQQTEKRALLYKLKHEGPIHDETQLITSQLPDMTGLTIGSTGGLPSVFECLSRPKTVFVSTFDSTMARGGVLFTVDNDWKYIKSIHSWLDNLPYTFRQIRWDLCFRIYTSANPQVSGELLVFYDPCIPAYYATFYDKLIFDMDDYLNIYDASHIRLGADNVLETRIPWGSVELWEDPVDPFIRTSGSLIIAMNAPPLAPKDVSGMCSIRVDMWLENIKANAESYKTTVRS